MEVEMDANPVSRFVALTQKGFDEQNQNIYQR